MCDVHYRAELARRNPPCSVPGCDRTTKAKGYCDKHYLRLLAHGHVFNTRDEDWGGREKHPLYKTWVGFRRGRPKTMCGEWANDFWKFADAVGDRPHRHALRRIDAKKPLGPVNWHWVEMIPLPQRAEYMRRWNAKNPKNERRYRLKKMFGITIDDFERMDAEQGGVCAICQKPPTGRQKNLCVDHCHTTGRVRGLLCDKCNRAIGLLDENPDTINRAVSYLSS